jgi:hypothetical protein
MKKTVRVLGVVALALGLQAAPLRAADVQYPAEALNMTLVGHVDLTSGGEGLAMKVTSGGRRLLYFAHETAPHCFSIIDVTDAAHPALVRTVDTVSADLRCNSLDVFGNVLVVAAEVKSQGLPGAGMRVYALDDPGNPKMVSYFDTSGPHSRGVHHVWLSSDKTAHLTTGSADFTPKRTNDDQFYMTVDLTDPAHPKEAGRWWYPGQRVGDAASIGSIPLPNPAAEVVRPHNIDVFPGRPNRAYMGYIDGGIVILDISDVAHPRPISIVRYAGPGFTHTAFPIFSRNLMAVSEEDVEDACADAPKRVSFWDIADETKPRLISVAPFAANSNDLCKRGGRYGAHNIYEDKPYGPTFKSDRFVIASFFGGGVRVFDIADPQNPKEAAYYVPATPVNSAKHAPQINDVFVDDRGFVYAGDRFTGGLYILQTDVFKK